ncbi:putative uncharacterized protein DDB_G0277255 isoform X2 [Drosophila guanche]|uniref:putative uncharacterized protein DDB_G0277255 isoform X2 n=1 Tax=Drosophila guanche TaxID=7266 RepID=UPI001470945B|nr:putative uncharacterized protein DDB_G0277255 isoform X2 [Drosophila guanche]
MAETINNKPSIQIRSGLPSPLPDKSPSPATKLLISHGKPNFTIGAGSKSPKAEENGMSNNPLSPQLRANNNYNAYKSATNSNSSNGSSESNKVIIGTKFNGVFKPSTSLATNGNGSGLANGNGSAENEAAKVVLRRLKVASVSPPPVEAEDDNVPEFIRRQRRIQERLAKENVLDFENRRSGYFTHVMISPDSPNRTSFVETMASPAIVPSLEMPAPVHEKAGEEEEEEQKQQKQQQQQQQVEEQQLHATPVTTSALISEPETVAAVTNGHSEATTTNGHAEQEDVAPEEVARAIEEVNKAVAGEDDDKTEPETEAEQAAAPVPVAVERKAEPEEESKPAVAARTPSPVEAQVEVVQPAQNGQEAAGITISHTNGQSSDGPSIPAPDPSGALGVNYEPKTVVSFSQELGGGENNYPDTVKGVTESADGELKDLAKLKFDIKNDGQADDVQVTPVLRAE